MDLAMRDDRRDGYGDLLAWLPSFARPERVERVAEARRLLAVLDAYERTFAGLGELGAPGYDGEASWDAATAARIAEAWGRVAQGRVLIAEGRRIVAEFLLRESVDGGCSAAAAD